jgi:hypothetical protein
MTNHVGQMTGHPGIVHPDSSEPNGNIGMSGLSFLDFKVTQTLHDAWHNICGIA